MWVSRFSIPFEAGGQDVALYLYPSFHAANESGTVCACRYDAGNRLAMLRDDDPLRPEIIQQRKALLFEFRRVNLYHTDDYIIAEKCDWS